MILVLILPRYNNICYSFLKEHERLMESGVDDEIIYSSTSTLMLEIMGKVHTWTNYITQLLQEKGLSEKY